MGAAPILAPTHRRRGAGVRPLARHLLDPGGLWRDRAASLAGALLPETLPPERRTRLRLGEQLGRYARILRERGFLTHAAMGGVRQLRMFAYLAGSSPVFIQGFGLTPSEFALIFGAELVSG